MPNNHNGLEKILWEAADKFRANSKLKPSEYSVPVLGLIFLTLYSMPISVSHKRRRSYSKKQSARATA